MIPLEYPPRPEGGAQEQIWQLWEYLFRLIERLNAEAEQSETEPARNG